MIIFPREIVTRFPLFLPYFGILNLHMNKLSQFASLAFLFLAILIISVQLIHPAPNITLGCTTTFCYQQVQDQLTVQSADYRGSLVQPLLFLFVAGLVFTMLTFPRRNINQLWIVGMSTMVGTFAYLVIIRFVILFIRWPLATWIVTIVMALVSVAALLAPVARKNKL